MKMIVRGKSVQIKKEFKFVGRFTDKLYRLSLYLCHSTRQNIDPNAVSFVNKLHTKIDETYELMADEIEKHGIKKYDPNKIGKHQWICKVFRVHKFVSIKNKAISSGEMCIRCGKIK